MADHNNNGNIPDFPEETPNLIAQVRNRQPVIIETDEEKILEGLSEEIPKVVENPLTPPVIQREREVGAVNIGIDTTKPLTEPVININPPTQPLGPIPTTKDVRDGQQREWSDKEKYATDHLGEKPAGTAPTNPAVTTMSGKEEKERLKMSVDTAIYAYSKIKVWIGEFFVTSPAKMRSLERTKKIKLDWAVDLDQGTGQAFSFRQFIIESNKRIIKACETSEEFKNKVRPLLEAEFAKRGWILSYQQSLMFVVGQDLFETGQKLFMVSKNMNDAMKQIQAEIKTFEMDGGLSQRQMYNMQHNPVYVQYNPSVQPQQHAAPTVPSGEAGNNVTENTVTENPASDQPAADTNKTEEVFTPPAED